MVCLILQYLVDIQLFKNLESEKKIYIFYHFILSFLIKQVCIKLIKSDSKDFYVVTQKFFLTLYSLKNPGEVSIFSIDNKIIIQHYIIYI